MRALLLVVIAACSGIPGDPDTLVVNGDAKAGYAWSGPGSFCCNENLKDLVGWQIWLTNTEACPTSSDDIVGSVLIVSPETVQRPSTELPQLTSMTVPLDFPDAFNYTQSVALFGVTGEIGEAGGTMMLRTYSADEISGEIYATSQDIHGKTLTIRASFDAHRCDRIHD